MPCPRRYVSHREALLTFSVAATMASLHAARQALRASPDPALSAAWYYGSSWVLVAGVLWQVRRGPLWVLFSWVLAGRRAGWRPGAGGGAFDACDLWELCLIQ